MDKFTQMQVFSTVVTAGSFVGAAEELNMSKAAVSRYINELETRLSTRLLHRTTRRLSLTEEGEVFLARCRVLLAGIDEAEAEITANKDDVVGLLRVSIPVIFGTMYLAPIWGEFMAAHPKVTLDVTSSDRVVDLLGENYDLAVRVARLPSSSLVSRKFGSTRMVLCASPEYLRLHGTPSHPYELVKHATLTYSLYAAGDNWEFEGPEGMLSVRVSARMRANSGDTCCAAALKHQGIMLQPCFLVSQYLSSGALVEVLPQYPSVELGVYAVYPTRKHLSGKVRALIEFLDEAFRTRLLCKPYAEGIS